MAELLPKYWKNYSVTKLYISSLDSALVDPRTIYYFAGKHRIYVNHFKKLAKASALVTIWYEQIEDVSNMAFELMRYYSIKRVFKSLAYPNGHLADAKLERWVKSLATESFANLFPMLEKYKTEKDGQIIVSIDSNKQQIKEWVVEKAEEMRIKGNWKNFDLIPSKNSDVKFVMKRVIANKHVYLISYVEGLLFTNYQTISVGG